MAFSEYLNLFRNYIELDWKQKYSILSLFTTVRGRRYVTSRSAKSFRVMTAATPSLPGYLFSMFLNHFVYTIYLHYIFLCTTYSSVLTPYSLPYKLQLDWKQKKVFLSSCCLVVWIAVLLFRGMVWCVFWLFLWAYIPSLIGYEIQFYESWNALLQIKVSCVLSSKKIWYTQ